MTHQMVVLVSLIITVLIIFLDYFFSLVSTRKREQYVENMLKELNDDLE